MSIKDNWALLRLSVNKGYRCWKMPCRRDQEISAIVDGLVESGKFDGLDPGQCCVLRSYAERMASLAVRARDADLLRKGLIAAGAAARGDDVREVLLILPLLWRSAELLGVDGEQLFRAAAAQGDPSTGSILRDFLLRTPENRSIAVMGYEESADAEGFLYKRNW